MSVDAFGTWPIGLKTPDVEVRPEWWAPVSKQDPISTDAFQDFLTDKY
jgi:hypothetical protein